MYMHYQPTMGYHDLMSTSRNRLLLRKLVLSHIVHHDYSWMILNKETYCVLNQPQIKFRKADRYTKHCEFYGNEKKSLSTKTQLLMSRIGL